MSSAVQTKFGNVSMHKGYLVITSRAEGNYGKSLHRLIFEDFYQCDLDEMFPEGIIIHHDDENKLNNEIWNLIPMTRSEHKALHNKGNKYGSYKRSEEQIRKIVEINKNRDYRLHTIQEKINVSKTMTSTGIFRVSRRKKKYWAYYYYDNENGKRKEIMSINLIKLREKVLLKGLEWIIIDEYKAKELCLEYNYDYSKIC